MSSFYHHCPVLLSATCPMNYTQLGDSLRDAQFRSDFTKIDPFLIEANGDLKQNKHVLDILRCLINLSADNDPNRDVLTGDSEPVNEFWAILNSFLEDEQYNERIAILLGQFIHATGHKNQYLKFLYDKGIHHSFSISEDLYEFLSEFITANLSALNEEVEYSIKLAGQLVEILKDEISIQTPSESEHISNTQISPQEVDNSPSSESDDLLVASMIPQLLSFQHTSPALKDLNLGIMKLLGEIQNSKIQRHLFAASGNISSMQGYEDWEDIKQSVTYITDCYESPYVIAAASINIGNYINSQDSLAKVVSIIPSPTIFINNFFEIKLGDVVQIQSVHMLRNLINDPRFVGPILQNDAQLLKLSKIIIDNGSYYPEILQIFVRFIVKLVSTKYDDILQYTDLWKYLSEHAEEVGYLLLQTYTEKPHSSPDLLLQLLRVAVSKPTSSIELPVLLSKLKTLGMVFHYLSSSPGSELGAIFVENQNQLLEAYKPFIEELAGSLKSDQPPILLNNARFVAAATISALKAFGIESAVAGVCKDIVV